MYRNSGSLSLSELSGSLQPCKGLENVFPQPEKFQTYLLTVQPAQFHTKISLIFTLLNHNVVYFYFYGPFQEGRAASTTLRTVTVQVTSDSSCNSAYVSYGGITV